MDEIDQWFGTAEQVLLESHPSAARELLLDALMRSLHSYLSAVVVHVPLPTTRDVSLHPGVPGHDPGLWQEAVAAGPDRHPLYAFHVRTGSTAPMTLAGAVERGFELSEETAFLIDHLGFSRHQLTVPLGPAAGDRCYALSSLDPFTVEDVARAARVQSLLAGLDQHVELLAEARTARELAAPAGSPDDPGLTARELVVLRLLARGSTVEGIAARLGISPRTVHKHQEHLYRKLGAVDRLSAVLSAQRRGLLSIP